MNAETCKPGVVWLMEPSPYVVKIDPTLLVTITRGGQAAKVQGPPQMDEVGVQALRESIKYAIDHHYFTSSTGKVCPPLWRVTEGGAEAIVYRDPDTLKAIGEFWDFTFANDPEVTIHPDSDPRFSYDRGLLRFNP